MPRKVYNEELAEKILKFIENGNNLSTSARLCNVSVKTVENWIYRGKNARSNFHDFYLRYKQAQAKHTAYCKQKMVEAGKNDWKMWRYKGYCVNPKSFPSEKGNAVNVDVEGVNAGVALFKAFERAQKKYREEKAKRCDDK